MLRSSTHHHVQQCVGTSFARQNHRAATGRMAAIRRSEAGADSEVAGECRITLPHPTVILRRFGFLQARIDAVQAKQQPEYAAASRGREQLGQSLHHDGQGGIGMPLLPAHSAMDVFYEHRRDADVNALAIDAGTAVAAA